MESLTHKYKTKDAEDVSRSGLLELQSSSSISLKPPTAQLKGLEENVDKNGFKVVQAHLQFRTGGEGMVVSRSTSTTAISRRLSCIHAVLSTILTTWAPKACHSFFPDISKAV